MAKLNYLSKVMYVLIPLVVCIFLVIARDGTTNAPWKAQLYQLVMYWSILVSTFFWVIVSPVWLVTRYEIRNKYLLMVVGLVLIIPIWFAMMSLRNLGPWLLLGVMMVVWIADSAAYFVGKRFGRHKLAPMISPGKTWEGVFGALIAVTIYALILCTILNESYWLVVGLWAITVLSIMGDLLESLMKRQAGVKDSGSILPGHGGVLDRIDGLTSTLPLAVFYIYFPLYSVWLMHG